MGIPSFYRWLSRKYAKAIQNAEALPTEFAEDGSEIAPDLTEPNPNGVEYDNLYLDMNGIVHPCAHPDKGYGHPETEEDIFLAVFEYIDHIVSIIRPRKVLYLALDGVAPRAKMNQQRSRRFKTVRDASQDLAVNDILATLPCSSFLDAEDGAQEQPGKNKPWFDNNAITPGTVFMDRLAEALRNYIFARANTEKHWKPLHVIFSDSNQPGEGEHKLVAFIRHQRSLPTYDPNTRHCIYGLDADLIMLALATHEPHFAILREKQFFPKSDKYCRVCMTEGHSMATCIKVNSLPAYCGRKMARKPYELVSIPVLRQYLETELRPREALPFAFDLERALDDWVFMCFLVGNDFLPHIPTLKIVEGAINSLVRLYRMLLPRMMGHMSSNGNLDLHRVQMFLAEVGQGEDEVLLKRRARDRQQAENKRQRSFQDKRHAEGVAKGLDISSEAILSLYAEPTQTVVASSQSGITASLPGTLVASGEDALHHASAVTITFGDSAKKRERSQISGSGESLELEDSEGTPQSERELYEPHDDDLNPEIPGYVDRYFQTKFGAEAGDASFRQKVCIAYVQGLVWVLQYYYQGCCSWKWFYPYHYAPFAKTLINFSKMDLQWDRAEPFTPIQQLMAVLPPASSHLVPECFRHLMHDNESPIKDFYPTEFETDSNGEVKEWKAIALLGFIREDRLFEAMAPFEAMLSQYERRRFLVRPEILFFSDIHPLKIPYTCIMEGTERIHFTPRKGDPPFGGSITAMPEEERVPKLGAEIYPQFESLPLIESNSICCCYYGLPQTPPNYVFKSDLLPGLNLPQPIDITPSRGGDYESQGYDRRGQAHSSGSYSHRGHHHHHHHHHHQQQHHQQQHHQQQHHQQQHHQQQHHQQQHLQPSAQQTAYPAYSSSYGAPPTVAPGYPYPQAYPQNYPVAAYPSYPYPQQQGYGYPQHQGYPTYQGGYPQQHGYPQQQQGYPYQPAPAPAPAASSSSSSSSSSPLWGPPKSSDGYDPSRPHSSSHRGGSHH